LEGRKKKNWANTEKRGAVHRNGTLSKQDNWEWRGWQLASSKKYPQIEEWGDSKVLNPPQRKRKASATRKHEVQAEREKHRGEGPQLSQGKRMKEVFSRNRRKTNWGMIRREKANLGEE